ncbi:HDOD domain-containing protein [bacterium]|nr:HDOD domain-containing protein [bacterium]NBW56653.1 HDOD domain-containing protein [bacterium]NBX72057.1 HDOD domain-containing protein [bacterium]
MLFKDYLKTNHIEYQEVERIDSTIPLLQSRFCKSPMSIAMILLLKDEMFLPTDFRGLTRIDYKLISPEEICLVQPGGYLPLAPKAFGLVGYVSSTVQEQPFIAIELEQGYALIAQKDWLKYAQLQSLHVYQGHEIHWLLDHNENVISVFSQRVIQRLPSIVDFPPLPISAERLIHLKSHPSPNIEVLTDIITHDPLLTAQIMLWARSPLYGPIRTHQVHTVRQAITQVLGYDLVMNLCLSLSLKRVLHHPEFGRLGWRRQSQQANLTGRLAKQIAIEQQLSIDLNLLELSGMLCDIGYFVLGQYFQPHFATLVEDIEANPTIDPCLIEFNQFHFTHQHLGAWLLKGWNFPYEVITAVQWHHSIQPTTFHDEYPYTVFLARYFLTKHGYGDEFKVTDDHMQLGINEEEHNLIEKISTHLIERTQNDPSC